LCLKKEQLTENEILQQNSEIVCDGEIRRDSCHHNFTEWNDGQCKRFITPLNLIPENFVICAEEGERDLTYEDIADWLANNPD
jgi:hypothetical protein